MKKLIVIVIVGMVMSSCSRMSYSYGGSAAGCTAWYPKKFKSNPKSWKIVSPRVQPRPRMVSM